MIIDNMLRPLIVGTFIAGLGAAAPAVAAAQTPPAPQAPQAARPAQARARRYALSVKNEDGFLNVALKARQARLADIAADLGKRLRARVVVGPELAKDTVSVDLPSSPLETVLQSLAPRVLVDYEVRSTPSRCRSSSTCSRRPTPSRRRTSRIAAPRRAS